LINHKVAKIARGYQISPPGASARVPTESVDEAVDNSSITARRPTTTGAWRRCTKNEQQCKSAISRRTGDEMRLPLPPRQGKHYFCVKRLAAEAEMSQGTGFIAHIICGTDCG
jgi:hypothetical protein